MIARPARAAPEAQMPPFAAPDGGARYRRAVTSDRADALADLVLLDHEGGEVRLGDLWSTGPVALVWLRHYG